MKFPIDSDRHRSMDVVSVPILVPLSRDMRLVAHRDWLRVTGVIATDKWVEKSSSCCCQCTQRNHPCHVKSVAAAASGL